MVCTTFLNMFFTPTLSYPTFSFKGFKILCPSCLFTKIFLVLVVFCKDMGLLLYLAFLFIIFYGQGFIEVRFPACSSWNVGKFDLLLERLKFLWESLELFRDIFLKGSLSFGLVTALIFKVWVIMGGCWWGLMDFWWVILSLFSWGYW